MGRHTLLFDRQGRGYVGLRYRASVVLTLFHLGLELGRILCSYHCLVLRAAGGWWGKGYSLLNGIDGDGGGGGGRRLGGGGSRLGGGGSWTRRGYWRLNR